MDLTIPPDALQFVHNALDADKQAWHYIQELRRSGEEYAKKLAAQGVRVNDPDDPWVKQCQQQLDDIIRERCLLEASYASQILKMKVKCLQLRGPESGTH